jgi:alpha-L-arabinofuranosidase
MTEPGGDAWRQTIYYPYYFASIYGRGTALQLVVNCLGYDADIADNVPYVDVAGVHNEEGGTISFFIVNRHGTETIDLAISLQGFAPATLIDHQVMTHTALDAANTLAKQNNVVPKKGTGAKVEDGSLHVSLPPLSYQMIRVKV